MKNYLFLLVLSFSFILVGCKSNVEKAEELIRIDMNKTLYDIESYSPIETTVVEAKSNMYNDSAIFYNAVFIRLSMDDLSKVLKEVGEANEHMDIWGPPTLYSSTYSDNQYNKYKEEFVNKYHEAKKIRSRIALLADETKELISKLDTTVVIGWEVDHRFRCKTKGGSSTIGDYKYFIDKGFKKIMLCYDKDNEKYKDYEDILNTVMIGGFAHFKDED